MTNAHPIDRGDEEEGARRAWRKTRGLFCRRRHERCRFRRWKKKGFSFFFSSATPLPSVSLRKRRHSGGRDKGGSLDGVLGGWKRRFVSTVGCRKRRKRGFFLDWLDLTTAEGVLCHVSSRLVSSSFALGAASKQQERIREKTTKRKEELSAYPARDAAASRQSAKQLRRAGGGGRSGGRRRRAEHRRRRHRRGSSGRSPLLLLSSSNATCRRHAARDGGCHG